MNLVVVLWIAAQMCILQLMTEGCLP